MIKYWSSLLILFIIDRLTKVYFINLSSSSAIGDDFLNFYLNDKLAFSLPLPDWLLYPLLFITIAILAVWLKQLIKAKSSSQWPAALILAGAISNFLDRLSYGGVVDFIDLGWWPVFNFSDVYISIGIIWILILEFRQRRQDKKT